MRVLWFANTPCEASEYLTGQKVRGGGWLYALCEQLKAQAGVELHVAFIWGKALKAFAYKGVIYHPVLRVGAETVWGRYVNRLKGQFSNANDKRELEQCKQIVHIVDPDIIHIHGSEEAFGLIAQEKDIKVPVVLSIQGLLSAYKEKYYSGVTRKNLEDGESLFKRLLQDGINGRYRNFSRRAERETNFFKSLNKDIELDKSKRNLDEEDRQNGEENPEKLQADPLAFKNRLPDLIIDKCQIPSH